MNPEQLRDTTMNLANRLVLPVTLEDAQQADETFTMLMGDHVPPHKRFICWRGQRSGATAYCPAIT